MPSAHYADRLADRMRARRTACVVGLDPLLGQLPPELRPQRSTPVHAAAAIEEFCGEVIRVVAPLVPAVKINSAFFEAYYEAGVAAFYRLIQRARAAGLMVIADIKRGDIGSTARLYALGHLAAPTLDEVDPDRMPDAVTLAGYLGESAIRPFIDAARETGRGMYVLVRPSDPGADKVHEFGGGERFYQHMARLVDRWGAEPALRGACGLSCVGAVVAPKDLASTRALRAALPHTPLLVPGYGAQGGALEACQACFLPDRPASAIVNASRSVLYAFDNAQVRARAGDDWRRCIESAARDLAAAFPVG